MTVTMVVTTSSVSAARSRDQLRCDMMQSAYQESLNPQMIVVMLIPVILTSGYCALVGPIVTDYSLTSFERLGYCALYACASWPICYSLNVVTLYLLRFRALHEIVLSVLIVALFAALVSTSVVHLVETLVRSNQSTTKELLTLYMLVALITVPCSLLLVYLVFQSVKHFRVPDHTPTSSDVVRPYGDAEAGRSSSSGEEEIVRSKEGHAVASDTALTGLPHELEGDVVYLKSEDHYVFVQTVASSSLIKMRFSDAVSCLSDRGVQVHRCYWG